MKEGIGIHIRFTIWSGSFKIWLLITAFPPTIGTGRRWVFNGLQAFLSLYRCWVQYQVVVELWPQVRTLFLPLHIFRAKDKEDWVGDSATFVGLR